jgi:hypothetical protein
MVIDRLERDLHQIVGLINGTNVPEGATPASDDINRRNGASTEDQGIGGVASALAIAPRILDSSAVSAPRNWYGVTAVGAVSAPT